MRAQLSELVTDFNRNVAIERASNPLAIQDLFVDPSYEDDSNFMPSVIDEQRESAYDRRSIAYSHSSRDVSSLRNIAAGADRTERELPQRIAALKAEVGQIDGSLLLQLKDSFTGQRAKLVTEIRNLELWLMRLPKERADALNLLPHAEERLAASHPNDIYDGSLHEAETARLLPRSSQSALLSIVFNGGTANIELQIPTRPDENDFSTTVKLELEGDDLDEFSRLIGEDIRFKRSTFDSIRESAELDFDIDPELVPFPLEVVEIAGEQRCRVPQAVWNRFRESFRG